MTYPVDGEIIAAETSFAPIAELVWPHPEDGLTDPLRPRGDREEARRLAEGSRLDVFEAAALGEAARVGEGLAEEGVDPNAVTDDGFTALHLAAFFSGDAGCARALLDTGADPDALAANETGLRPINSAAAASSVAIVRLLIERGADVDAAQHGGYTPLHSAAANAAALARERGHPDLARRLEELAAGPADA